MLRFRLVNRALRHRSDSRKTENMDWKQMFRSPRFGEIAGVFLLGLAVLSAISIATYHPDDPSFFFRGGGREHPANAIGTFGATLSAASFQVVGLGAFLLPVLLLLLAWDSFRRRGLEVTWFKAAGYAGLLVSVSALFSLSFGAFGAFRGGPSLPAGGWLGGAADGLL